MKQTAAALLFALAGALPLAAQQPIPPASSVMPPGYLQAMPMVDRVLADMKVADSVETRARRIAAVSDLGHILDVLTRDHLFVRGRSGLTPEEDSLDRGYRVAWNDLFSRSGEVPGLSALIDRYSGENAPFRSELLDRYFSPAWKTAFLRREAQYNERIRALAADRAANESAANAAADPGSTDRVAAPAVHGAPVPPDQRRFAVAVNEWCRRFLAPEPTNPIAREQFQREASRQAADISRSVGLVRSWSGVLLGIESYTPVIRVRGEDASGANLVVSVDTAATVKVTQQGDSIPPAAFVNAAVGSSSPIYAAAGRLQLGQWVVFSGRALEYNASTLWTPFAGRFGGKDRDTGEPVGCFAPFKIVLTALRPAP